MLQFINRVVVWEKGQEVQWQKLTWGHVVFLLPFSPYSTNYFSRSLSCVVIDAKVIYLMIWRVPTNLGLQIVLYFVRLPERVHPWAQRGRGGWWRCLCAFSSHWCSSKHGSHCWSVSMFCRWKKSHLFSFRISTLKGI